MLIWCILVLITSGKGMAMIMVQEVSVGDMVVLKCPSNDEDHRFQYWELSSKDMIGPGNNINHAKYKYEVLTGTLFIKGISSQEGGMYTCISRHLLNPTLLAKSIELIVKKDFETAYEEDSPTNVLQILVVVMCLSLIAIVGFIIYTLKRDRLSQFRDFTDEESGTPSRDDIAGISGSYKSTVFPIGSSHKSNIVIGGNKANSGIDNPNLTLDTDFPREFTSVNMPNVSRM